MSLRKGTLEEYFNSGPVANQICGKNPKPGQPRTCYQDQIEPDMLDKLSIYVNRNDAPNRA